MEHLQLLLGNVHWSEMSLVWYNYGTKLGYAIGMALYINFVRCVRRIHCLKMKTCIHCSDRWNVTQCSYSCYAPICSCSPASLEDCLCCLGIAWHPLLILFVHICHIFMWLQSSLFIYFLTTFFYWSDINHILWSYVNGCAVLRR